MSVLSLGSSSSLLRKVVRALQSRAAFFLASRLGEPHKASLFFALQKQQRLSVSARLLSERPSVRCGLFEGMLITKDAIAHQNFNLAHVLGTFEPCVQNLLSKVAFQRFVAIGCGCGFYSVGMAHRFGRPSVGYDIDAEQIRLAEALAALNGLSDLCEHVQVPTNFDYRHVLRDQDLVLIDIDGGEIDLFKNLSQDSLPTVSFLVECHRIGSQSAHDVAKLIASRCQETNTALFLDESHPPSLAEVERTNCIGRNDFVFLAREQRKQFQWWLFLQPRNQSGTDSPAHAIETLPN